MSKNNFSTVYGVTVYPIDYLCNGELTETDLSNLLDNNGNGLLYSLIIGMFRYIGNTKRNYQIIKSIKSDKKWPYNFHWSQKQRDEYEELVTDVYKNIYQFKGLKALSLAQWFMTMYGLQVEGNKIDLEK